MRALLLLMLVILAMVVSMISLERENDRLTARVAQLEGRAGK